MLELNKIYQGDCLEVMKQIPDKSVDMILADLPYGTTACKWDTIIPFEPLWEQYKRIIKDNGAIVLTASQPFTSALVMSNIKMFKYEWIWNKNVGANFLNSKFQPLKIHENILVFSNGGITNGTILPLKYNPQDLVEINKINKNSKNPKAPKTFSDNGRMSSKNSCLQPNKEYLTKYTNYPKSITNIFKKDNLGKHPTQKPVALFEYLIKTYTNENDLVLDNVCGSGTTGVACKNLNRNFILIEQDENYCKIASERTGAEIIT